MTSHPPTPIFILLFLLSLPDPLHGLGASSTIAAVSSVPALCGVVAGEPTRRIECFTSGGRVLIQPNITYDSLSGGSAFFCGLRSGGTTLLCWDPSPAQKGAFFTKRIYFSNAITLSQISVGHDHICAIVAATNKLMCWRGMRGSNPFPILPNLGFRSISSGLGFSCGVLVGDDGVGNVRCWGSNSSLAASIQVQFANTSVSRVFAGAQHLCGFKSKSNSTSSDNESLICKGSNANGQLDSPIGESFTNLALGFDFTCGIRQSNRTVTCWGGGGRYNSDSTTGVSFELITAGSDFVCGLNSGDFSVICWGPGWPGEALPDLPLSPILPGRCVQSSCQCGTYPESEKLCSGSGLICNQCDSVSPSSRDPPPSSPLLVSSSPPILASSSFSVSKPLREEILAFVIIGSVGGLAGIGSIVYCLYIGVCCGRKKVHNSVQPQITRAGSNAGRFSSNSPPSRHSLPFRRQCSRVMRRQRSGTSSTKHPDRAEEFAFSELAAATDDFSMGNKIGAGSFGVVYRGKLSDGREVAIKRGETSPKAKKFQEKESAFESELSFLSRLHHKHLVRLVGFCQERDERLLVYEYMKNGALYDHLHDKKNVEKSCSVVNSWKIRIRVALDAARGIEYLHNYAVPPIIHRDIKSSNILLDTHWTASVSDFGLSLMGPEANRDFRPSKAAGTVGYIDPEYYGLNVLTAKSDVYGLGVVLLELLTGKRAIFKADETGGVPTSVVDYAVEAIVGGELGRVLDPRVGAPAMNESEAVELVAYTAMHCVNLEGKDRPTMSDIVANLERALALCDESHGSISSASMSAGSG